MAKNKGGLGRGLDSLFADTLPENESESGGEVTTLPLRDIEPDKDQPRKAFEEESLTELAASITEHGLLQPIAVRPGMSSLRASAAGVLPAWRVWPRCRWSSGT